MATPDEPRSLGTIDRAVEIVDLLKELDGAGVAEVAEALDIAPSTAHGYLSTLERNRYLVKEDGAYHVGMRFLHLGGYASVRKPGYKFAKRKVRDLARETGERAQFIVEEHGRGTYLHTGTEDTAVQIDARIGKENYLHASAAGKAILANLPGARVDEIVDRWGLPSLTENTITDRGVLEEELARIREQGYSYNRDESVDGLRAVGSPVMADEGEVLGALSISAPSNRMRGEYFLEEIPRLLLGAANEVELNIAYD